MTHVQSFTMTVPKICIVFLAIIAAGFACELSAVCDTACETLEAYIEANRTTLNSTYRPLYHVAPPFGWMNDPNGFIYYKGLYHIFYQFYPYDSKWGPMHWGHSTSNDLVNWTTQITAMIPGTEQCFSGGAVIYGTSLILMYTGHVVVNSTTNDESQYLAFSDNGINFIKYSGNPVLRYSTDITADFRDPKVWKYGDYYYAVIGTKNAAKTKGRVVLYRSADLLSWTYLNVLFEASNITESAYMFECPDFFELDGTYVLMMSPQGMQPDGDRFKNLYQTGYILGTFSYDTFEFVPTTDFQELDYGHDFYATQTTYNDGKRILVGWLGMWQNNTEGDNVGLTVLTESVYGWAGMLTIFRELSFNGTRIVMKPVEGMTTLRDSTVLNGTLETNAVITLNETGELIVSADWSNSVELQMTGVGGGDSVTLSWNVTSGMVTLDRGDDDERQVEWTPDETHTWRIFLDASSIELFCGEGDVVFSSRVYPLGGWVVTNLSTQTLEVVAYSLSRSVPE